MSSSDSSYDSSSDSEAAEVEVEYDLEVEGSSNPSEHETLDDEPDAYANEPMADEEWLAQYEEERKTEEELEKKLQNRLSGSEEIRVLRGLPMSTLRFYKVNPLLSSFSLLRFISPFKRYGMKRNTFCLTWLIITAENNAFIWHFQDF